MTARPADFDRYWEIVDERLAATPDVPELTHMPLRSNEHCDVYSLRLTSYGPYRIAGYLSVPKGSGPFPGLLLMPVYGSVKVVPDYNDRVRYLTLQILHRGQRHTDEPWAAAYPGLLTERIDDPERYIYRDIVADCVRGAEYLLSRSDLDPERVAVSGDDLALLVASRRPRFTSIVTAGLVFHRTLEACARTEAYPLEEINEYVRTYPERAEMVKQSLSYLDPVHHVGNITGTTNLSIGSDGSTSSADWLGGLIDAFGGPVEQYKLVNLGGTDHDAIDEWLSGRMGVPAMSRFIREFA